MTTTAQRQNIVSLIGQACKSGARLHMACQQIGMSCRTLQRWLRLCASQHKPDLAPLQAQIQQGQQASVQAGPVVAREPKQASTAHVAASMVTSDTPLCADRRLSGLRQAVTPHNKLTQEECEAVLAVINSEEFKDLAPSQIVPRLADQGRYLASESTMQRLLLSRHQNTHRRSECPAKKRHKPFALKASVVNQVFTWDITYLPTTIKGQYFYLYVFVDIFSRFIVGAQVFECESADLAADLLRDICLRHNISEGQVHLHSDNGSPMKGQTMLAMMHELGVIASRSRPSVSNDNPYSESLFGTLKYRPLMPVRPFESLDQARKWAIGLVDWYNQEHRHSAIKFVTPQQRHCGEDALLLQKRAEVYGHARDQNPSRWSKNTRNWSRVTEVHLNPDKPDFKEDKSTGS
jgi:transposase InsO family protein